MRTKTVFLLFLFLNALQGQDLVITKFFPIRTVIKTNDNIPLLAVIQNTGNNTIDYNANLIVPPNTQILEGEINSTGQLQSQEVDSIYWTVKFTTPNSYHLKLQVAWDTETIEKEIVLKATDTFWVQKNFILSAYNPPGTTDDAPPYEDTLFTDFKDANMDLFLWVRDEDDFVDIVRSYDFKYLMNIGSIIDEDILRGDPNVAPPDITPAQLQDLDSLISKYKNDPNLIGYYLCDEPFENGFNNIATVIDQIRQKDPTRFSFVNLWPYFENEIGDENYIESFIQITKPEFISYDRYNFYNFSDDNEEYFDQIERIRKLALKYDIPFCNIVQAVGTNGTSVSWNSPGDGEHLDWRTPNAAEHRWLVYSSLTYGVHGLVWFPWDTADWGVIQNPDKDTIYPSIQSVNGEIDSLKEIMLGLSTKSVYHLNGTQITRNSDTSSIKMEIAPDADFVVGFFEDKNQNDKYFMLMNKDTINTVDTEVKMTYFLNNLEVFNTNTNTWENMPYVITSEGSNFQLNLRAGAGKLFKFSGDEMPLPVSYLSPLHGVATKNGIRLNWVTAQEINADYFVIQRLAPNNRWKNLQSIPAGKTIYRSLDQSPLEGVNIYRLKQFDLDEKFSYSNSVSIVWKDQPIVQVIPNPSHGVISFSDHQTHRVEVRNYLGQIIFFAEATDKIHLAEKGIFFVTIWDKHHQIIGQSSLIIQ